MIHTAVDMLTTALLRTERLMDISEKHQARLVRPPDQAPLPGPGLLDLSMPNIASLVFVLNVSIAIHLSHGMSSLSSMFNAMHVEKLHSNPIHTDCVGSGFKPLDQQCFQPAVVRLSRNQPSPKNDGRPAFFVPIPKS